MIWRPESASAYKKKLSGSNRLFDGFEIFGGAPGLTRLLLHANPAKEKLAGSNRFLYVFFENRES